MGLEGEKLGSESRMEGRLMEESCSPSSCLTRGPGNGGEITGKAWRGNPGWGNRASFPRGPRTGGRNLGGRNRMGEKPSQVLEAVLGPDGAEIRRPCFQLCRLQWAQPRLGPLDLVGWWSPQTQETGPALGTLEIGAG